LNIVGIWEIVKMDEKADRPIWIHKILSKMNMIFRAEGDGLKINMNYLCVNETSQLQ
jgi:hypothetical protein